MAGCEKHPRDEAVTCARCGKNACAGCGAFRVDDATLCAACGESVVQAAGFPLGTVLIAMTYLGVIAVLAATKQMRPWLLGAAALFAIALARIFAVNPKLRRPTVVKAMGADDGKQNVRVARSASIEAPPQATTDVKPETTAEEKEPAKPAEVTE